MDSKGQPQSEIKNPVKDIPGSKDVVPEQISHRLNELEAKLIEQDHRWVNVLIALYTAFRRGEMRLRRHLQSSECEQTVLLRLSPAVLCW